MKYDFHVHTSRYSPCAVSPPEEMCRRAVRQGLQGIALTEHDLWWSRRELQELQSQFPQLTLFRGVEYALPEGHFLVFLPDSELAHLDLGHDLLRLLDQVHGLGGIVIWAHPFRYDLSLPVWLEYASLDGMEVASNNMGREIQRMAREVARRWRLTILTNSDAHHPDELGKYYNDIPQVLEHTDDLVDYLKFLTPKPGR